VSAAVTVRLSLAALGLALLACEQSPLAPDPHVTMADRHGGAAATSPIAAASCTPTRSELCDVREAACQLIVHDVVRCLTNDQRPLRPPPVRIVSEKELSSVVTAVPIAVAERARKRLTALSWFGLAAPPEPGAKMRNPLGFYSYRDREIYLSGEAAAASADAAFFTLVHELVHAAQDAEGELGAAREATPPWDQVLARRALLEGEARYYTDRAQASVRGFRTDAMRRAYADDVEGALLGAMRSPAVMQQVGELFELPFGARWTALDTTHVASALRGQSSQPSATCEVMGLTCSRMSPIAPQWPARVEDLELAFSERLGHWLMGVFLARVLRPPRTFHSWQSCLVGDSFAVYEMGETPLVAVWSLEFTDVMTALEIQQQFDSSSLKLSSTVLVRRSGRRIALIGSTSQPWPGATPCTGKLIGALGRRRSLAPARDCP